MPQNDHQPPRRTVTGIFPPNPRADFVELGVTSCFSFLNGASDAADLVLQAHALGYDTIGIADLNTLAGVVRVHSAAERAGLRAVIGARIVLTCGTGFLAYPRDRAGYGRLSALISKGRRYTPEGVWQDKGACDLTLDDLAAHAEGVALVWLPPPAATEAELAVLPGLKARLPSLIHVAASFLYRGEDRARINRLDRAARANGISILATNDVLYHAPHRRPLQDVMTCIRHKTTIREAGYLLQPNAERHLKSPAEMARLFAPWPHAIDAARDLADACAFSLHELAYEYPRESVPDGRTPDQHLAMLTWQGAAARYPQGVPVKVCAAIDKELSMIARKKIAQYFLTINDIVRYARGQGILCQGRGSAANSAVCYVLGITPVDPDKFDLLFERFISEDRDEPPDIDVDFEHERREEVIQHIYDTYGRDRAGLCATVIHYRPRSAIREVGRAMGLTEDVTAALAGTVWGSWGDSLDHAGETGLNLDDPLLSMTLRLAQQMIGMPRHLSQHVGGFILTEGLLTETVPIGNGAMPDRSFIEWDKDDIDALGILKVDVLALGMLTCIRKCFDLIRAHYGHDWTLATVPGDDRATYEMLQRGDSVGVFQVESRAQMNMLPRLKPERFYDLVIEVAIVRPGPVQGDMVHPYLRRRNGQEAVEYPTPGPEHPQDELEKILRRTLGVPIFQEQAMKIALDAARFSPGEANELRKAMATFRSRGTIDQLQDKMVGRMIDRGYDPDFARRCFDQIKGFGEYGFPESHAAAFAHLVYVSAWIKRHYPDAFAAGLLNSQPMGFYAPAQIVRDAEQHGVGVRAPDVNFSDWENALEPGEGGRDQLGDDVARPRSGSALVDMECPPGEAKLGWDPVLRTLTDPLSRSVAPLTNAAAKRGWAPVLQEAGKPNVEVAPTSQQPSADERPHTLPKTNVVFLRAQDARHFDDQPVDPAPDPSPALDRLIALTRSCALSGQPLPHPPEDAVEAARPPGDVTLPIRPRFALRLGLRQIDGLAKTMAARLTAARAEPYATIDDMVRRAGLDTKAVRQIAAADAVRSMGIDRRGALWETKALRDAPDLPLFTAGQEEGPEPTVILPAMPVCEHVVADYQTLRLSLKAHPMAFLRRSLTRQGYTSTADLHKIRNRQRLKLAGIVLIRQRPGSAKGVCFVTLEDEGGVANLVVWPKVFEAFRGVVMGARLLVVEGQVQRGDGVTHIVAERLEDRTEVLSRLSGEKLDPLLARADESRRPPIHPAIPHPAKAGRAEEAAAMQARAEAETKVEAEARAADAEALRRVLMQPPHPGGHPRNLRIIPKSRDFH